MKKGEIAGALLAFWLVYGMVYSVTASHWLASLATALCLGAALASR